MIEVESLSKYYSSRKAIEDVSFAIGEGEIIGLLGLNGAGKSTILKILGCFLMPSGGNARVGGHSVTSDPAAVRKLIGYLPDTPPLYNEMTVVNYLRFIAKLKDVPSSRVETQVDEAMTKTNLGDMADVNLGALSHGYRQRVGIAQAVVHGPPVLILDEPINGLDPVQIVEMRDLILSLKNKHTVILSSHILSEITRTCDRILVIDKGRLVAEGSEAKLKGSYTQQMRLEIEVGGDVSAAEASLAKLEGVADVARKSERKLLVELTSDVRADVAEAIVKSGGRLLALQKADEGLEALFMKLIQAK